MAGNDLSTEGLVEKVKNELKERGFGFRNSPSGTDTDSLRDDTSGESESSSNPPGCGCVEEIEQVLTREKFEEIMDGGHTGTLTITDDVIVTPAARDAAKDQGVEIDVR
ncbi:MAG: hypothetical protein ABEJ65_02825 [bacterium]